MLVASTRLPRSIAQRSAFTLVEVLVVVAIVVILASVGTLATFKFLADAKIDNARMTAMTIEQAAKTYETRNPDGNVDLSQPGAIEMLVPYLEKGAAGTMDPWGQQYQIAYVQNNDSIGSRRVFVYTVSREDGKTYGWPREFEPAGQ